MSQGTSASDFIKTIFGLKLVDEKDHSSGSRRRDVYSMPRVPATASRLSGGGGFDLGNNQDRCDVKQSSRYMGYTATE